MPSVRSRSTNDGCVGAVCLPRTSKASSCLATTPGGSRPRRGAPYGGPIRGKLPNGLQVVTDANGISGTGLIAPVW